MADISTYVTESFADDVANCVISIFNSLPKKFKPRDRVGNVREWTPLCGIVLSRGKSLKCVALGTGSKCLPASLVPEARGNILHDWHAETIAIRAFNYFLIEQCKMSSMTRADDVDYVRLRGSQELTGSSPQPFEIKDDVKIHMYCSEAPCGDASMELIIAVQDDDTPWERLTELNTADSASMKPTLLGRKHFLEKGIVRRKPARSDAPESLSKSCTDKIALKQCTSLLDSASTLLLSPRNAYLETLVVPQSQFISEAFERAFAPHGRFRTLENEVVNGWKGNFIYQPVRIQTSPRDFEWSRRNRKGVQKYVATNTSTVYTIYSREVLVNGVLQGRKQDDAHAASSICRRNLWQSVLEALGDSNLSDASSKWSKVSYEDLKNDEAMAARTRVKVDVQTNVLHGWIKNVKERPFTL